MFLERSYQFLILNTSFTRNMIVTNTNINRHFVITISKLDKYNSLIIKNKS